MPNILNDKSNTGRKYSRPPNKINKPIVKSDTVIVSRYSRPPTK